MNGFNTRNDNRLLNFMLSTLVCMALAAVASAQPQEAQRPANADEPQNIVIHLGQSEVIRAPWPVKRNSVTDAKIAEAEPLTPDQILLQGKALGTTDLILWNSNDQMWRARVDVEMDLRRLKEQLGRLFFGSDLELMQNANVVVVSGVMRRTEDTISLHQFFEAMKIPYVDATRVAGVQQVLLQVRVAEANRTSLRALGVNALATGAQDNTFFGASTPGPSTGGALSPINIGPPQGALAGNEGVPFTFNNNLDVSPLVTMNLGFPRGDLQFLIQALAENQYLQILAEPNLVAQSGEEATFLAGGEFPIPVAQGSVTGGGVSITIEYKDFGVKLRFRPMVLGDGLIRLFVAPEVSELSDQGAIELQGFRVPAIRTRRAATTLELHSGQTFSMAGLIDKTTEALSDRIPALGDLPILGSLFRSVRYKEGESEMVVLVTTSLVEPMSQKCLPPLPGMTHRRPNDWELYMGNGSMEGSAPPKLSAEEQEWLKKLGFDDLRGPGAWANYEQETPAAAPSNNNNPPAAAGTEESTNQQSTETAQ